MSDKNPLSTAVQPSREVMPTGSVDRVSMTLLIGIAVFAILMFVSHVTLDYYSGNAGYRLVRDKWELLLSQESPVDILVLGDSSANQGIDTDFIARATGLTALNLATVANALVVNDYWMLQEYIDRVGLPECVVVVHASDVWYRAVNYSIVAQIPIKSSSIRERLHDLESRNVLEVRAQRNFLIARYFKAYSENLSMKRLLMQPWTAWSQSPLNLSNSGFHASFEANPELVVRDAANLLKVVQSGSFEPSGENKYSLERMVSMAGEQGFHLYLANSPLYRGISDDEEYKGYLMDVNTFISDATYQHDNVTQLFVKQITYGADEMQYADHIIASAAEHFTRQVIDRIECGQSADDPKMVSSLQ